MGDILNSVGVIVAATIILIKPNWWYVDPLCTYFFSAIVFYTTFEIFSACISTFLEGSPEEIDYDEVKEELKLIEGVDEVHDLHIWSISQDKHCITVHLVVQESHQYKQQLVLAQADHIIRTEFSINHITIQIETEKANETQMLPEKQQRFEFRCGNDLHI